MIEDCVIIGGGIAGLSAANQLTDRGCAPLLIEATNYPAHRICGEFFSPECLPILQRWNIPLSTTIQRCQLFSGQTSTGFELPRASGSCSRYNFDFMLQQRAQSQGARILTNTTVTALDFPKKHDDPFILTLSNGQIIEARHLMLGTGKIPRTDIAQSTLSPRYVGFKAHFKGVKNNHAVEMHCFDGGYLGISPVDANTTNVACLVKKECVTNADETMLFLHELLGEMPMLFPRWLTGQIPEFGIRNHPVVERVFWIGDAAGSIPPISGDGLAIGITSGCMAADYLLDSNAEAFKKAWLKRYQRRFIWAVRLHKMMLSPWMSKVAIGTCNIFPALPKTFWKLTRE